MTRAVTTRPDLERRGRHALRKTKMGKEYSLESRGKAVGMVWAEMERKLVCKRLGISRTQLYIWLKREKTGEGLRSKAGHGRRPSVHPVAKRVVVMS